MDRESKETQGKQSDAPQAGIVFHVTCEPIYNYSLAHIMPTPLRGMAVQNNTDSDITDLHVVIDSATDLLTDRELIVESVPAGETVEVDCSTVMVDIAKVLQITETTIDQLNIKFIIDGEVVCEGNHEIAFFAFDQWLGIPETIAAFATPNHPAIAPVLVKASQHLKDWTKSSALDGYQSDDKERVRKQAAAIFRALQEQAIIYAGAPASFSRGQRIRMPDMTLSQHMATCLDFAVLYAACLEAASLHPLIVLVKGHAFAGVWLEEKTFPESVIDDVTSLTNRAAKGVEELTFVECTMLAQDSGASFEKAERQGRENLDTMQFEYAVDVTRARYGGVLPLPVRIMGDEGWEVEAPEADLGEAVAPTESGKSTAFIDAADEKRTKKQLWERSLLDLSMHNNLLNMRYGQRAMPIFAPSVDEVEDTLAMSNDLVIAPKPDEFPEVSAKEAFRFVDVGETYKDLLRSEFKDGRLRTAFTEAALKKNLDTVYRSAKSSLEETGANTLFLTLGTLIWVDAKRGNALRHAPIMLFPIDIIRKSARAGYVIRLRDEDPVINISLIEMLRADYDIHINGLDPLPQDEAGVDTRLVLNTFRQKVKDQPGWEVLEAATLGLFSFGQFVMWNDIRSHEEALRKSPVIESMLEGHLTWVPEPLDDSVPVDPSELLLPIEADASQLFAIKAALSDNTFVLHGPPGTGKSQTITAIISNALARGKKVLFVAEKMAALEVVEKRLAALGLGTFCLEVHSTKATKNHVLEQIQQAVEIGSSPEVPEYEVKLAEVRSLRARLDQYANGLARENAAGFTLREQICGFEELASKVEPMDVGMPFVASLESPADFAEKMNAAERLVAAARDIAPTARHPLYGLTGTVYTQTLQEDLIPALDRYESAVSSFGSAAKAVSDILGVDTPRDMEQCQQLLGMTRQVVEESALPQGWSSVSDRGRLMQLISHARDMSAQLESQRAYILGHRSPSFLQLDLDEIKNEWIEANSKGVFGKGRAVSRVIAKVALCSLVELNESTMGAAISELEAFRSLEASTMNALAEADQYLNPFRMTDGSYDWDAVSGALERLAARPAGATLSAALQGAAIVPETVQKCVEYAEAMDRFSSARGEVYNLVGLPSVADSANLFEDEISLCRRIRENVGGLREWMAWNVSANTARTMHLDALVEALETQAAEPELFESFKCGAYKMMCTASLDATEGMNGFSSARFDEVVKQYSRADKELRKLATKQIYYEVASRVPDMTTASAQNPNAAKLQKSLRSRGRNVSIRSVLSETGDVVRDLCPCFLMSPLSVAQYLEPGEQVFDLLIFDEASQLQTCKAVGPLSRAKNAIIVGDPRQMPPTSFFQGKVEGEDFEEVSDLESVLEDCLALNLPQTYLRWHYRSKHESLIAFSNKRFYESKMLTFPSVDDRLSRVQFVKVPGFFDRGGTRTNQAEAEAIVEEIKRRASDPVLAEQSLGVITFNIPQQSLIEDLLLKACADDPALEKWVNREGESLFIKNLENVQGDERDIILFSITYAPDKTGKMSMNFGPINREGGWRRLNVAVTRARYGMAVFSSMEPTDIDLNRVSSMGPAALQSFLAYARNGVKGLQAGGAGASGSGDDWIAEELCRRLAEHGYKTVRDIGKSEFKIDIGVVNPRIESSYLAAVMLDGSMYGIAKTTRDREISQPQLLRNLGWHTYRVLTLDWWNDPDAVVDNLVAFLKDLEEKSMLQGKDAASYQIVPVSESAQEDTSFVPDSHEKLEPVDSGHEGESVSEVQEEPEDDIETASEHEKTPETDAMTMPEPSQISKNVEEGAGPKDEVDSWVETDAETVPEVKQQVSAEVRCEEYRYAELDVSQLNADEFAAMEDRELAKTVDELLAVEAPVELSVMMRRVAQAYGLARAGSRVQAKIEQSMRYAKSKRVTQAGRVIIWRTDQDPKEYRTYRPAPEGEGKRNADEVPLEEIAAAACAALTERGPLPQDELAKAASQELGYKHVASTILDYMKRGISLASRRGLIAKEGKLYTLASEISMDEERSVEAPTTESDNQKEPVGSTPESGPKEIPANVEQLQDRQFLFDSMSAFIEDGEVSIEEAASLKLWMVTHKSMADDPVYRNVFEVLDEVLADGIITQDESVQLTELFDKLTKGD